MSNRPRAVPRFDMAPGERLTPIREIKVDGGHLMAARDVVPEAVPGGPPLLAVRNLTKGFGSRIAGVFGDKLGHGPRAVDDVSFEIGIGECLGLVGESGCGKTTTAKMILRSLTPDSG